MATTKPGDLMTIAELAELVGCSLRSAQAGYCGINQLPKIRLGKQAIRYRRRDVERWLEDSTREPARFIEQEQRRSA